ncbi:hypothetical protein K431DRAFT_286820 [Polychaeton citri CBS 116435]|uniref:MICOS complex subunit MIC60 n=1 Tax=Polychaeton citri CBS 116435 TaxID=1314669 RepID=A0A9P4Q4J5_9PEZI|nr:hypothetical protein K431DRAFT_286820 [Polychaeton citri CBS 116435]
MLRPVIRAHRLPHGIAARSLRHQWQSQRVQQAITRRAFADEKGPDKNVLPGSESNTVAGIPQEPILDANKTATATPEIPPSGIPKIPPTPAEAGAISPPPPALAAPAAPKPKRRFRRFVSSILILAILGYAGGVYYSLVNDNFHDFFSEFVPYGEDAVAYFEEREFRKRFPNKVVEDKKWPQLRGEQKVTIGKNSGLTAKAAQEEKIQDLGVKGRHMSSTEENKAKAAPVEAKTVTQEKKPAPAPAPAPAPPKEKTALPKPIDHINVAQATEPVVQKVVKMVNDIITAVNASPEASKYASTISSAKAELQNVIAGITELKDKTSVEAENQIKNAHTEFDSAAKELVRRLQGEMHEQEAKWREEYETERERLSTSYSQRLAAELEATKKLTEEKNKNALLEQEISLQKRFAEEVRKHVEEERDGRLSKLDQLSTSVADLEKLTGDWTSVIDSNLQTQHLHIALEAIRAAIHNQDVPKPFLNELVALKEIGKDNELISSAIASIHPASYQRGIPSPSALIDRFRRVASEVRKASLLPEDAGIASHAASAVLSKLMFEKRDRSGRGLPEGNDVEAILGRAEVLLEEGRLDEAAREMNGLKGWAGVLSRDWVDQCRRVLEVQQAVDVISTEARLRSLLVE